MREKKHITTHLDQASLPQLSISPSHALFWWFLLPSESILSHPHSDFPTSFPSLCPLWAVFLNILQGGYLSFFTPAICSCWCGLLLKVQFKCHILQLILSIAHQYPLDTFFHVCQLDFQPPVTVTLAERALWPQSPFCLCAMAATSTGQLT